jgi:hypothetical protein
MSNMPTYSKTVVQIRISLGTIMDILPIMHQAEPILTTSFVTISGEPLKFFW